MVEEDGGIQIEDELRRREMELHRIDRKIDGLQHNLARLDQPQGTFIGSGGSLASAARRRKELRHGLALQRAARGMILQQVRKAQERLELIKIGQREDEQQGARSGPEQTARYGDES